MGKTKFLVGLVLGLSLVGCEAGGVVIGGDTGGSKDTSKTVQPDNPSGGSDTEDNQEIEVTNPQPDCTYNNTCPRDTMSAISAFEDLDTMDFAFPSDLSHHDAWLNQQFFASGDGYDLSSITDLRISFGSYFFVKSPYGDRVLSFANHGPYWAGSNDYHVAQNDWLTVENARWTGTHTATLDLCIRRVYECRTISVEVE